MNKFAVAVIGALSCLPSISNAQVIRYQDPFDTFFDTLMITPQKFESEHFVAPKMDVADLPDKIEVKAELPGMDEEKIDLSLEDGVLTLSGQRQEEISEENKNYYLKETSNGAFKRSVRLPKNIDESKIDAVFKNGILTITIPKTEAKAETLKKIPIKKAQ